jgi:hypothetical protein
MDPDDQKGAYQALNHMCDSLHFVAFGVLDRQRGTQGVV